MSKGGGGSAGGGGFSMSQTNIPPWVQGPAQDAISMASTLANRPVQTNPYEQVAPTTADQQQAYQQVRDLQGSTTGAFNTAMQGYQNLAGQAAPVTTDQLNAQTGQLYNNYQNTVGAAGQGMLGGYLQGGPLTAGQVGAGAQQLMSPYTQSVIDPTVQQMRQGLAQNLQQIGKNASDVGAYGGSRQGVTEGVAQGQEAIGEGALTGQLLNNQWGNALNASQQIGQLGSQQGYNAASGLTNLAQQGFTNAQQQGLDLSKLNMAGGLSALQNLPQTATNYAGEQAKEAGLLQTVGQAQQQQGQSQLDTQAGTWQEAQNWPVQNLDILLSALTGTPYPTGTQSFSPQQKPQSNVAGQVIGGLETAASIAALFV